MNYNVIVGCWLLAVGYWLLAIGCARHAAACKKHWYRGCPCKGIGAEITASTLASGYLCRDGGYPYKDRNWGI